jgi:RNA recognition motif-containing protein
MGSRLYVGNLSFNTTELELREVFSQCGTVAETKMVMDRPAPRLRVRRDGQRAGGQAGH